jgi:Phosphopantetheine attachment site
MTLNSEVEAPRTGHPTDQALQAENPAPSSASEKYMASLWSEIIGLEQVSLPHKFLEMGGNSLTLNIILNRIGAEKGVSLNAQLFFDDERSSLFELAKELDVLLENKPDRPQETTPARGCQ